MTGYFGAFFINRNSALKKAIIEKVICGCYTYYMRDKIDVILIDDHQIVIDGLKAVSYTHLTLPTKRIV